LQVNQRFLQVIRLSIFDLAKRENQQIAVTSIVSSKEYLKRSHLTEISISVLGLLLLALNLKMQSD
jgi:hypothetical protein